MLYTTQSSFSELKKQVSFEYGRNRLQNRQKAGFGPSKAIFHTNPESTHNMPVNKVSWSDIKKFLSKWLKTSKNPNLTYFL